MKTWLKPQAVKDGWEHGGGSIWGWWPYDPKTNLVYYGTGNPSVWNPDVRPGDNKWSMTIFARDLDTGIAKWGYQMTPHDEWDYDGVNEVILFDKGGKTYAWHHDRNGFAYTFQANNGSLVAVKKVHPFVNWATEVDMKSGIPQKTANASTHADYNTKGICPAAQGTKDQQPAAYSPKTGWMYTPLNHLCMTYEPVESKYVAGQPWVGATLTMFAGPDGVMGGITENSLCLGDQIRIGSVLFEISQSRQPCWKLNDRFGVRDMAQRVQESLYTGFYCRVLEPGTLAAKDEIQLAARPHPEWMLRRLMDLLYHRTLDHESLKLALELPLVSSWRKLIENRLSSGQVEDWANRITGPSGDGNHA